MAQEFLKKIVSDSRIKGIDVISRGIFAFEDSRMPQKNIDFLKKHGIEYKTHTAKLISKEDILTSDLIFAMTSKQIETLIDKYPEFSDKIHLFLNFAQNENKDMQDPVNKSGRKFEEIGLKIKTAVLNIAQKLNLIDLSKI